MALFCDYTKTGGNVNFLLNAKVNNNDDCGLTKKTNMIQKILCLPTVDY